MCTQTAPSIHQTPYSYQKKYRLADIYRLYWKEYLKHANRKLYLQDRHLCAVAKSLHCRTGKLGYHLFACPTCQEKQYLYHSCKHRFCGSCGVVETYHWAEKRLTHLLDIKHHHVVFTLPAGLRALAQHNGSLLYHLFFRATSQVLLNWFAYKHGIKPGIVSVLHTAGSDLKYHPHLHLIVSAGGIYLKSEKVVELQGEYLCRAGHLKRRFRWVFEKGLIELYEQGKLTLPATLSLGRRYFLSYLKKLNEKDWVVCVQPSLADRGQIIKYVGRYTKRACLSESRISSIEAGMVGYTYKDYKNSQPGEKPKQASMRLPYAAFLDRLLQHVPAKGYRMVRYYGCYAARMGKQVNVETPAKESSKQACDPDFSHFESHWQQVYGEQALQCKSCQIPYRYQGQYFLNPSTNPLAKYSYGQVQNEWDSS